MRLVLPVAFVVGTAFFAVLPVYAPPVVLQADEVPRFSMGLAAAAVAGVVLGSVAGFGRGVPLVPACAFVGAVLYEVTYAIPTYGTEGARSVVVASVSFVFLYLGVPATAGAVLVGTARALVARLRRGRGVP